MPLPGAWPWFRAAARRSAELELPDPVTFVLGAEREGVPDDVLATCEATATIPQAEASESLNVAVAGAIALYEWRRRR